MEFDALVLAGGRSSRLGGTDKALLEIDGRSLLDITLAAVTDARLTVVVGEVTATPGILVTREFPAFGGPAAGIAAGLAALSSAPIPGPSPHTLVLACDMPRVTEVVAALLSAGGGIAVDEGRDQYLAGLYPSVALLRSVSGRVDGLAVRSLLATIEATHALPRVAVPAGSTHDIDTWTDAELFGAHA